MDANIWPLFGLLIAGPAFLTACGNDSLRARDPGSACGTDQRESSRSPVRPSRPPGLPLREPPAYRAVLTTDGESDRIQDDLAVTTATFSDLTPAKTYFLQVFAKNEGGISPPATATGTTEAEPETVVQVTQDILTNTTWTSDKIWVLNQPIFVGRDCGPDGTKDGCIAATLTIQPGTTILG